MPARNYLIFANVAQKTSLFNEHMVFLLACTLPVLSNQEGNQGRLHGTEQHCWPFHRRYFWSPGKQSTCIARGTSTSRKAGRTGESPGNAARVVPFGLEGARLHLSCTPTPPAAGEDQEIASTEHVLPHPELLKANARDKG